MTTRITEVATILGLFVAIATVPDATAKLILGVLAILAIATVAFIETTKRPNDAEPRERTRQTDSRLPTHDEIMRKDADEVLRLNREIERARSVDLEEHAGRVMPADERPNQHLYQEIFEIMANGRVECSSLVYHSYYVDAGQAVDRWVKRKFRLYVDAYPGVSREGLKARFYDQAYRLIKRGRILDSVSGPLVVQLVENFLDQRVSES